jgi:hypothetical protein
VSLASSGRPPRVRKARASPVLLGFMRQKQTEFNSSFYQKALFYWGKVYLDQLFD